MWQTGWPACLAARWFRVLFRSGLPVGWRRPPNHLDYLEPQVNDPEHESGEGCLVWQHGAKGRRGRAYRDLAVIELRAQGSARLAREGELVCQ